MLILMFLSNLLLSAYKEDNRIHLARPAEMPRHKLNNVGVGMEQILVKNTIPF
jgi:hypothetical protein